MDKVQLRLIQYASAWAALGLLYGCNALTDSPASQETYSFSAASAETNGVLQPVGGAQVLEHESVGGKGLPKAAALRMRAEDRYGIVLVVPKDREQRDALGSALEQAMLAAEDAYVRPDGWNELTFESDVLWLATLTEFVVSCVPEWRSDSDANPRALLVSPGGEIICATELHMDKPSTLVREVRELCAQEPYASQRAAQVDPKALAHLDRCLEAGGPLAEELDVVEGESPWHPLRALLVECLPALSHRLLAADPDAMDLLYQMLMENRFAGLVEHRESTPVVHGVKWNYANYNGCAWCGMGYFPAERRIFDTFLDE